MQRRARRAAMLLVLTTSALMAPAAAFGASASRRSLPVTMGPGDAVVLTPHDQYAETVREGVVGGSVPATLSLSLQAPASFGSFAPGVRRTYQASTTAAVTSTAGDATLNVFDPSAAAPGRLVNGSFALGEPVEHDTVTVGASYARGVFTVQSEVV